MDKYLALTIGTGEEKQEITAPSVIPQGGLPKLLGVGSNIVTLIFILAIIFALFIIIIGGVRWILSGGDKSKIQTARQTIIYAVIGLIVLFLSYFIVNFIITIFGIEIPTF